jgi:glucose/arabinose dehydrogenase
MSGTDSRFAKRLSAGIPLLLLGFFLSNTCAQNQPARAPSSDKARAPIAISALPSGKIAVLESRGGLSLIDSSTGRETPLKETLGNFTAMDMTSAVVGNEESLFVTMYWVFSKQALHGNQGLLVQYSLQGQEVRKWSALGHVFSGIAVDQSHNVVYLASANSGEIWAGGLLEHTDPKVVEHVGGASLIGPLALDADGQRLFVADLGSSSIFVVDLARHKSRLLVSGLGEPAALSFEPSQHKLYIADAGRHRVSQISVDSAGAKLMDFSTTREIREPRGLAVAADRSIWVGDFEANAVFRLSPDGKLAVTVRR